MDTSAHYCFISEPINFTLFCPQSYNLTTLIPTVENAHAHLALSLLVRKQRWKKMFASSQPLKFGSSLFWQPTFYIEGSSQPFCSPAVAATFLVEPSCQLVAGMCSHDACSTKPIRRLESWCSFFLSDWHNWKHVAFTAQGL